MFSEMKQLKQSAEMTEMFHYRGSLEQGPKWNSTLLVQTWSARPAQFRAPSKARQGGSEPLKWIPISLMTGYQVGPGKNLIHIWCARLHV